MRMFPFFRAIPKFVVHHWKTFSAGFVLFVVVLVGGYVLMPSPSAQGAEKGHEVQIYRNAHIQVVFSQPMDHASVEKAFKITPTIKGSFSWQGNVLTFQPADILEKGSTYVVEIGDPAKSMLGKPLSATYRQTFTVLDFPEVAVVAPVDGLDHRRRR